jgi:hypothetical protein
VGFARASTRFLTCLHSKNDRAEGMYRRSLYAERGLAYSSTQTSLSYTAFKAIGLVKWGWTCFFFSSIQKKERKKTRKGHVS